MEAVLTFLKNIVTTCKSRGYDVSIIHTKFRQNNLIT